MKTIKENANQLIISLCEIIVGILLFINPTKFTSGIIILLGIVLTIMGIIAIIGYFRINAETAAKGNRLTVGLIYATLGIFCMFCSDWFIVTFPILTILYGILILIAGITKIQWVVDCLRLKKGQWFFVLLSAVLTILTAIIILANPFTSTTMLWQFAAIALIIEALLDIIAIFIKKKKVENIQEVIVDTK